MAQFVSNCELFFICLTYHGFFFYPQSLEEESQVEEEMNVMGVVVFLFCFVFLIKLTFIIDSGSNVKIHVVNFLISPLNSQMILILSDLLFDSFVLFIIVKQFNSVPTVQCWSGLSIWQLWISLNRPLFMLFISCFMQQ